MMKMTQIDVEEVTPLPSLVQDMEPTSFIVPAVIPSVRLSLSAVYTTLYALLFVAVLTQLFLILYYRHKRLSYQSIFLFLCLVWSGLRTTLFCFYFESSNVILANNLGTFWYWLLYCLPVCLQFLTLCLLVEFFTQMVFRAKARYEPSKYKKPFYISLVVAMLVFTIVNIVCAVVTKTYQQDIHQSVPIALFYLRVIVNDGLFITYGVLLSISLYKLTKTASSNLLLEARGTTKCQAMTAGVFIILLYTSRAAYNMLVVLSHDSRLPNFGYSWSNVSDQGDLVGQDPTYVYVVFGVILFIWEFLPTLIVIIFFRVRSPEGTLRATEIVSSRSFGSRAYFFDNPRRYDSEESLVPQSGTPSWSHDAALATSPSSHSVNSALMYQASQLSYGSVGGYPGLWSQSYGTPPHQGRLHRYHSQQFRDVSQTLSE
ncbi:PREDICTED: integral membrane protein GPR137B-like [Priapulus caudatus]|uniref:Integral membrane protein GPR137B-like n=1 Tax=Priapulus caudatus TaxID=37621 RepID=A0ABM1E5I6_PRICU|nr:PREDICTED: integral membrane protein GPR137B-like [Priapulus caudatus]